jgi:hypothetical protein
MMKRNVSVLSLFTAALIFMTTGCPSPSDPGGGWNGDTGGNKGPSVKYVKEFWGEWLRMDSAETWYIAGNSITINGSPSARAVTLSKQSGRVIEVREGSAKYYLYASRIANARFTGKIAGFGQTPSPSVAASRAVGSGLGGMGIIISNLGNKANELTAVTDADGNFSADGIIPGDDYTVTPAGGTPTVVVPNGGEDDVGTITVTGGYNFKTSVKPQSSSVDMNTLYATRSYDLVIEIENTGTEDCSGPNYQLTLPADLVNESGFSLTGILGTVEPGAKKTLPIKVRCLEIAEEYAYKKIGITINDAYNKTWEDSVSLKFHRVPMNFNIRSDMPISGIIISPAGQTYSFIDVTSETIALPWSTSDYLVVFSGATIDTETIYSLGVGVPANANFAGFTDTGRYEQNNTETTAPLITQDEPITAYLHKNDIDYYRVKMNNTSPPVFRPVSIDNFAIRGVGTGDDRLYTSESAYLDIRVKNNDSQAYNLASLTLASTNSYVTIDKGTGSMGNLPVGHYRTLTGPSSSSASSGAALFYSGNTAGAFKVTVSPSCPIGTELPFTVTFTSTGGVTWTGTDTLVIPVSLPAPGAPSITAGDGQLALSWTAVTNAAEYEVYYSTGASIPENPAQTVSATTAAISGLTNGTTYNVWIKAKTSSGVTSTASPMASGKPIGNMGAVMLSPGDSALNLSWISVPGADEYELYCDTSATMPGTAAQTVSTTAASITGLTNGTSYNVWVKPKNAQGTGGVSAMASGTPLAVPGTLTVSAGNGQLTVNWAAVSGATGYEVYYSTISYIPSDPAVTVTGITTTLTGLTNGTTYNVWVKAKNTTGTSGASPMASGKPIGNMGTVTVSSGDEKLNLSWSAVAGADEYEVYYSTGTTIPGTAAQTVSTTTANITGLTNGTSYNVWVKPKNAQGTGGTSTMASGKPIGNMGAVTVISGDGALNLSWVSVSGADEYEVYYSTGTIMPGTAAQTVSATTASITGLTNGTNYNVWVKPRNAKGTGGTSTMVSGTPTRVGLYDGAIDTAHRIGNQNLSAALTWLSANAVTGHDYYIVLGADESLPPNTLAYSGKTVGITLVGEGGGRTISLSAAGSLFTVESGVTLTLDNDIILRGRSGNNASLIRVNSDGKFAMEGNAVVSGNSCAYGGGVYVNYGIFTMKDNAEVSGNTAADGGGVFVYSGTFTMQGNAEVSGNTASTVGGGVYVPIGTFTMQGNAVVSGNNTSGTGGGVYISNVTFTMQDSASVSGNTALSGGGVSVIGGTFIMEDDATISDNTASTGGGVYVHFDGTFTMQDNATISDNAASDGGGVCVNQGSTFIMEDDATISDNTASVGGGVYVNTGTFTMQNDTTVSNNTASNRGGGVSVIGGTFTIQDSAVVSGNTASYYGGGVSADGIVTFRKTGGIIYGDTGTTHTVGGTENTATSGNGHAVYLNSSVKKRNSTAGTTVNLYAKYASGAWSYNDTSPGGAGDTTANWE